MAKLKNAITGVPAGDIYPREIPAGEECPENLLPYAREIGALEEEGPVAPLPASVTPEGGGAPQEQAAPSLSGGVGPGAEPVITEDTPDATQKQASAPADAVVSADDVGKKDAPKKADAAKKDDKAS